MKSKDVDEKDVDKKLIGWNDIFGELAIDAQTLIKDLSESMNYIAISALIVIVLGVAALVIGFGRGETKYIAAGFIFFSVVASNGAIALQKWYNMRKRYDRLQSMQKKMENK